MNRASWCAGLFVTACATTRPTSAVVNPPDDPAVEPAAEPGDDVYRDFVDAWQQSRIDLNRLGALEIFEVRDLWMAEPLNERSCYGMPCGDELTESQALDATRQAARLADLVDLAEAVVAASVTECASGYADPALAMIRDLRIVEVGELLLEEAEADPNCYNLPCPAEVERVEAANCARIANLAAIAEATRGL